MYFLILDKEIRAMAILLSRNSNSNSLRTLFLTSVVFLMVACSSGGGGGGGTSGGITYVGNTDPAVLTATNTARLVGNVVGSFEASDVITVGVALNSPESTRGGLSQSALANRLITYFHDTLTRTPLLAEQAVAAIAVDDTIPCDEGSIHVLGTLNEDGTGEVSATYNSCRTGEAMLSGEATLLIVAYDLTYDIPTDATYSFTNLTLTIRGESYRMSGSVRDQQSIASNTETLTINMITQDELSDETIKDDNLVIIIVSDDILDPSSYTETLSGRVYDSEHGYVDVTTVSDIVFSSINQECPDSGQLRLDGAANASIRVTAISAALIRLEVDRDGDSSYEINAILGCTELDSELGIDLGDTDGDGMHNSWETWYGLDPSSTADADLDSDGDGFTNLNEYLAGSDPGDSASTPVSADLAINMTGPSSHVAPGETFSYNIIVQNGGPSAAVDVVVSDELPAGMSLVSTSTSLGSCSGTTTVTCNLGGMGAGADASIILSVTAASTEGSYSNTASVTSTIADGDASNNATTVIVMVAATNTPPVAVDDPASTVVDTEVLISVLANDSDADGDTLSITEVTDPLHGSAAVESGAIRYTPDSGYVGEDTFNYTVSDGNGGTDVAAVTVTVTAIPPEAVIRVSVDSSGGEVTSSGFLLTGSPVISADGRYVAFRSDAAELPNGGVQDVFLHDTVSGDTTLVSVDSDENPGNGTSRDLAISADGRYVVFRSAATNLVTGDNNGVNDIFLRDTLNTTTTRISVDSSGIEANGNSFYPDISDDGRYVVFYSTATNLVSGDTNGVLDVFRHDTTTGATTRISLDSSASQANGNSLYPAISADGRYVAFESTATNLVTGDTNARSDIFRHDTLTGATTRVSVDSGSIQGNNPSYRPVISADGRYIAFESSASNLVSGDSNVAYDIFRHDTTTGDTIRVSVDSAGNQSSSMDNSNHPAISDDGRYVVFDSSATNLVSGDTILGADVFMHDTQTGDTNHVSVDASGIAANGVSVFPEISADGRYVVYYSAADNLVSEDGNSVDDAFRVDVTALP